MEWFLRQGISPIDFQSSISYNHFTPLLIPSSSSGRATTYLVLLRKEVRGLDQDHIMLQDGRVMIMRNGERMPMDDDITLSDGTKVAIDGTVLMPDGTTRMMDEGETMLLQGQPAGAEDMSDKQFKESMEDEELRDDMH
jgi:hypothetical protein